MELKDWLNSINFTTENLSEETSSYPPYIVNRCLSGHLDCIMFANEMNRNGHLDHRMQYDFLRTAIRPRKRFSKWHKKTVPAKNEVIKEYYGYSDSKAESVADLISDEDIKHMKSVLSKGGKKR